MSPSATPKRLNFSEFGNVIDNIVTKTAKTRSSIDPATGDALYNHPVSTAKDIDDAVAAARRAFPSWSKTPLEERRQLLKTLATAVEEYTEEFANLIVKEQGKPFPMAKMEVGMTVKHAREVAVLELPTTVFNDNEDKYTATRYVPLGVVCGITPWNYPLSIAMTKIAPAVVTGNCLILKPSPYTPYCGIKLVELAQSIFPPGVLQVVTGEDDIGPMLTDHSGIAKITFTGSIATGIKIMRSASRTLKRLTMELGGNDPAIIFPDVDVTEVALQIAQMAFINTSQICVAIKRVYVHEDIYPEFREAFVAATKALPVGNGMAENIFMGPVQNKMQYERVKGIIEDSRATGQVFALGGEVPSGKGYFVNPTIVDRPHDQSRLVVEEPFGPIVPLLCWKDEADVITRANATDFGLGASVWSKDVERATRMAEEMEAGNVWVNQHMVLDPLAAFSGHKFSGLGVERGALGLAQYCNVQSIHVARSANSATL